MKNTPIEGFQNCCFKGQTSQSTFNDFEESELYDWISELTDDCYTKPVGISDQGEIPDNQMTASSQYGTGYQSAYGRLNGDRGDG